MKRIICHWTAGKNEVNGEDIKHYHYIIDGGGNVVEGIHKPEDNLNTSDGNYAAHTKGCNTGSIGVSLAGMLGAVESPFNAGAYPINAKQFEKLVELVAQLSEKYKIPATTKTILSHAEVEKNLGIKQKGKWDYTRLPFLPELKGASECGNYLRNKVKEKLG